MEYTLYLPDESRRTITADTDERARILARRILRTRGKWTFWCEMPRQDERCVQGWNLDPPRYGERSRVAILAAPYDRRETDRARRAAEMERADYDVY